jgi:hypothetical protein
MSENHLPTAFPTRQAAAIPGRSRRGAVTGKLKTTLDLMVWENLKRKDAAAKAGLTDPSLRFAFRKPHVMAYYRAELAALRENLRARNIHRLDGIADDSKNDMARVGAIKALELITDQADERGQGRGSVTLPGLQIVIFQCHRQPSDHLRSRTPHDNAGRKRGRIFAITKFEASAQHENIGMPGCYIIMPVVRVGTR